MVSSSKYKMVTISYVPLLWTTPKIVHDREADSDMESVIQHAQSVINDGANMARGVMWSVNDDGIAEPTFVIDNARGIYDHLVWWSENSPQEYFKIYIGDSGNTYHCMLAPIVERSMSRMKFVSEQIMGIELDDSGHYIIFVPIKFVSIPNTNTTMEKLKAENRVPKAGTKISVGFIDSKHMEDISVKAAQSDTFAFPDDMLLVINNIEVGDPEFVAELGN